MDQEIVVAAISIANLIWTTYQEWRHRRKAAAQARTAKELDAIRSGAGTKASWEK